MTDQELREQAEVMMAYANAPEGKKPKLEVTEFHCAPVGWVTLVDNPKWNCSEYKYRLAPSHIAPGHNPDKLTVDQIPDGYRLMTRDEVLLGAKHSAVGPRGESGILAYDEVNGRWLSGSYWGTSDTNTYCVPIDWKDPLAQSNDAASAIAEGHNPHKLTNDQVGVSVGYRLLSEEETRRFTDTGILLVGTEWWNSWHWTVSQLGWYAGKNSTLRTKNPPGHYLPKPKKLIRKPCGPEHFPPGTILKYRPAINECWAAVLGVTGKSPGICDSGGVSFNWGGGKVTFYGLCESVFMDYYVRSLDGGKTWLPCYVEVEVEE